MPITAPVTLGSLTRQTTLPAVIVPGSLDIFVSDELEATTILFFCKGIALS